MAFKFLSDEVECEGEVYKDGDWLITVASDGFVCSKMHKSIVDAMMGPGWFDSLDGN